MAGSGSPETLKQSLTRVFNIIDKLEAHPIAVPFAKKGPRLLTWSTIRTEMFYSTFTPLRSFYKLAEDLIAIETNNQTALPALVDGVGYECDCHSSSLVTVEPTEANAAISCGDGEYYEESTAEIESYLNETSTVSPLFAGIYLENRINCNGWLVRPKWRYTGSFSANTSTPLLVVSTRYDPVSPFAHARAVKERFFGAGMVIQESMGHCSVTAPSVCTAKAVRAYFEEGRVPRDDLVCQVKELPFIGRVNGDFSSEDGELEDAMKRLSEVGIGAKLF